MKSDLSENELRTMQYIDDVMIEEGITFEKMSQENVFSQISIPELVKFLGMAPREPKEILESLEKKRIHKKI